MPLLIGVVGLVWIIASIWVASRIARLVKPSWLKPVGFVAIAGLLISLPAADEIIGGFQLKKYCESVDEITVYGTIPVGEELYTADGTWRTGSTLEERNRLSASYESLVRWEFGPRRQVPAAIPIYETTTKIYDKKLGRLLAEFKQYSTRGGWLHGENPLLIQPGCYPAKLGEIRQMVLPFAKSAK